MIERVRADGASSASRRISIAAAIVFGLLAVTAMVLALRTEHHVERNRAAGEAAHDFGALSGLIQSQELLVKDYGARRAIRRELTGQTRIINERLERLSREPRDAADAAILAASYGRYLAVARRYFSALDNRRSGLARQINNQELTPDSTELTETATAITEKNALSADQSSTKLEDVSETMLVVLSIAFLLAGGGLYLLSKVGRRSQEAEAEAQAEVKLLEHAARTDSLTDLRNHRAFEEDLAAAIAEAGRTNTPLCLVSIDVKGLKQVNDSLGHQVGDRLLRKVGTALSASIELPDAAYRVGGDEFAILLRAAGAWTGFSTGERVRAELKAAGGEVDVSAGVAEARPLEGGFDLVRHADLALINAKRTNREVIIYSSELERTLKGEPVPADEHQLQVLSTALARAVDAKDSYTRSHSETVSNLCVLVGTELGLGSEHLAKLRIAGLLHDVGKIGTPDAILNKPSALEPDEYATIKEHPVLGEGILRAADLDDEAVWVRHHHERPDGTGYPDGLRGDEIPIESRVIGVADAFEAMISDRPYGLGRTESEALQELEDYSGTQFDPRCVAALRSGLQLSSVTVQVNGSPPGEPRPAPPRQQSPA
jgi:diguanylate cyclase (GGDEF)-like protein/putative nucleotidyltransferase with HDIG domain